MSPFAGVECAQSHLHGRSDCAHFFFASSTLLAAGLVMMLAGYRSEFARVVPEAGLIILMATPAARVVISVIEYIRERDWVFVVLTVVVLLALAGSVAAAYL